MGSDPQREAPGDGSGGSQRNAAKRETEHTTEVRRVLETVYAHGDGWVHLSTTKKQIAAVRCSEVGDLADTIAGKKDVYLSAAVVGSEKGSGSYGRIEDEDASQLTALWVDIDRDGPGHKGKGNYWTKDDLGELFKFLHPDRLPTAIIDSGGGWWPYYVLSEPVPLGTTGEGELLLARWARWWHGIAEDFDRQMDGVFNPGRIVRAPGSINGKEGLDRPARVAAIHEDRTYSLDFLDGFLPAPEPPRRSPTPRVGDGDSPGDIYNQRATVDSMVRLLEAEGFHSPTSKGQRVDLTRPGKDARDGHSVTVWDDAHVTFWSSAPEGLPGSVELRDGKRASGTYDPFGVYAAIHHRGDFSEAAKGLYEENVPHRPRVSLTRTDGGEIDKDFWTARPELAHVRTFAHARRVSPYGCLGVVLARAICRTPPMVVIPPLVGSYASLNMTVGLVGTSGRGKGAVNAAGSEAVDLGADITEHTLGTGHGIVHAYAYNSPKTGLNQFETAVLFTVEEVDHIAGHSRMQGSTTLSELRRFGMGEKLGAFYSDPKKRVEVKAHQYRGAVIVGIQPRRAGVIIDAADGGTPQRFFWVPTLDANAPDIPPDTPDPIKLRQPLSKYLPTPDARGKRPLIVCTSAVEAIDRARLKTLRGEGDDLDAHRLLTRLRIAAALGIFAGRYHETTEDDWQLADHLMAVSDGTRQHVIEELTQAAHTENVTRGRAQGTRQLAAEEVIADRREVDIKRVAQLITEHLEGEGWVLRSKVHQALASRDRHLFDEALERLEAAGAIDVDDSGNGTKYRSPGVSR